MEQNLPVMANKVCRLVRVVYLMLRKGISKRKLLLDLNMIIKRGKIARKALQNLMFHHNKHHSNKHQDSEGLDMMALNAAMVKAMEIIHSENASPALPGFGRSPVVRQLRVTDSPFPVSSVDEDSHVDEAAEKFISKFYNNLRRENTKASFG